MPDPQGFLVATQTSSQSTRLYVMGRPGYPLPAEMRETEYFRDQSAAIAGSVVIGRRVRCSLTNTGLTASLRSSLAQHADFLALLLRVGVTPLFVPKVQMPQMIRASGLNVDFVTSAGHAKVRQLRLIQFGSAGSG